MNKNANIIKLDRFRKLYTRELTDRIKATSGCKECGESHPACLQFHHRDSSIKEDSVSRMVTTGASLLRVREEIAKCDVLCANCHFKLHAVAKQDVRAHDSEYLKYAAERDGNGFNIHLKNGDCKECGGTRDEVEFTVGRNECVACYNKRKAIQMQKTRASRKAA